MNRKKIFDIIKPSHSSSMYSNLYDALMMILIGCSIVPLAFRVELPIFEILDKIAVSFFIVDYFLRWLTADFASQNKKPWKALVFYPFTTFAIIDLLSIIPSFNVINPVWKILRVSRLLKLLRIFKFIRYSKNIQILIRVLHKEKSILFTVMLIAFGYILVTALIMFNVENSAMFTNYFDALYWSTTTLTTVGYGDIYPQTDIDRFISMVSAIMGVAVIALPSGVITASYLEELRENKKQSNKEIL